MAAAEKLWQQAEQAATNNIALLTRVRLAHLPVRYVWLSRWQALRKECQEQNGAWPLAESRKTVAEEWHKVADGIPGLPWTKVTLLNEAGLKPDQFLGRFAEDSPK